MNVKGVMHGPGPMFASKRTQEEMLFKSAWKLSVVQQAKETDLIISRVFGSITSPISKRLKTDTFRSRNLAPCVIKVSDLVNPSPSFTYNLIIQVMEYLI